MIVERGEATSWNFELLVKLISKTLLKRSIISDKVIYEGTIENQTAEQIYTLYIMAGGQKSRRPKDHVGKHFTLYAG